MSLLTFRQGIADTIEDEVKDLAKVYVHGGRFDLDELKRRAVNAPCVVVAAIGFDSMQRRGGTTTLMMDWSAFLIAKGNTDLARDSQILVMLEAVMGVINPEQRFGDDAARSIDENTIKGSNLYSGKLDSNGVALWGVQWTQGYEINAVDLTTLDDFLKFRSTTIINENEDTPFEGAVDLPAVEA